MLGLCCALNTNLSLKDQKNYTPITRLNSTYMYRNTISAIYTVLPESIHPSVITFPYPVLQHQV